MDHAQAIDYSLKGAMWLERIIENDGRIIYGYDCKTLKRNKGYNILRHAGSIWAMLGVYEHTPHQPLLESATRSLQYIKDNYGGTLDGMEVIHEDGWIKLGGNGLVSMAMLECYRMHVMGEERIPGCTTDPESYRWLLDYGTSLIPYMFKCRDAETKLFTHHKRNVNTGADKGFNSSFYPGEALLAMITGYKTLHPDNLAKDSRPLHMLQETILAYFILRETEGHVRDHWMMQAIEKIAPFVDPQYRRTVLFQYAVAIKDITINDSPSGSAGASAARTESLLAYLKFHSHTREPMYDEKEFNDLKKIIENQLDFQASCFVNRGLSEGAFRAKPDSNECRCDCTQHNISSFLGYHLLTK